MRAIQTILIFLIFIIFDKTIGKKRTLEDLMRDRPYRFNKDELTQREKGILDFVNSQKHPRHFMNQVLENYRRSATESFESGFQFSISFRLFKHNFYYRQTFQMVQKFSSVCRRVFV